MAVNDQDYSKEDFCPGPTKAVKTAMILALRDGIASQGLQSVDPVLSKTLNISTEFPYKESEFPCVFLQTHFNTMQWSGINDFNLVNYVDSETQVDVTEPMLSGVYQCDILLNIYAFSNEERDALMDAIMNMLMFGHLHNTTNQFVNSLDNAQYTHMNTMRAHPIIGQDQTLQGELPWQDDWIVYFNSIMFKVVGVCLSRLDRIGLVKLTGINLYPTIEEVALEESGEWV
jgi:hypothetical protein